MYPGFDSGSDFSPGLQFMPSILSSPISLDTNMALSALRLVVYHLPEENPCSQATEFPKPYFRICAKSGSFQTYKA